MAGSALDELYNLLNKGKQTSTSGGTTTTSETTQYSKDSIDAMLKQALESNNGLSAMLSAQAGAGLYNSSTNKLLVDDLLARTTANIAAQTATKVRTVSTPPQTTTTKNQSMTGKDYAGLLLGTIGKQYGDKWLKNKNPLDTVKSWFDGGSNASAGSVGGGGSSFIGSGSSAPGLNIGGGDMQASIMDAISPDFSATTSMSAPEVSSGVGADTSSSTNTSSIASVGEAGTALMGVDTSVPGLSTGTSVQGLGTGTKASTQGTFGDMFSDSTNTSFTNYSEADAGVSASGASSSGSSSSSSGGSWLGAITGAINGSGAGARQRKTDPAMNSHEDGYGTYHEDYRADVGGGIIGGIMGYYGGPVGASLADPVVDAIHPFMQDTTRDVINFGDDMGGAGGAFAIDPIGAEASGKYNTNDKIDAASEIADPLAHNVLESTWESVEDSCFITTAVCTQLGKADDCEELTAMRKLRDEYALTNGFKHEVDEYYEKAPKIVEALRNNPSYPRILSDFYNLYIVPAVSAVHLGQYEKAHVIYRNLFNHAVEISGV